MKRREAMVKDIVVSDSTNSLQSPSNHRELDRSAEHLGELYDDEMLEFSNARRRKKNNSKKRVEENGGEMTVSSSTEGCLVGSSRGPEGMGGTGKGLDDNGKVNAISATNSKVNLLVNVK